MVFQPSKSSVATTNEEIVDFTIKIINNKLEQIKGNISIQIPTGFDLISKNNPPVVLNQSDSTFISVRIFVGKRATSGNEHLVHFSLNSEDKSIVASGDIKILISEKRSINMHTLLSNILLEPTSDSMAIPLRIVNRGNTAQKITLINRVPSLYRTNSFHESSQFIIQPAADTLITYRLPVQSKMLSSDGFDINFTGLYENGDVFAMAYVRVQNSRNDRRYSDESGRDSYDLNSITFATQNMFNWNQSYIIRGRGAMTLPTGHLGYGVDLTTWKNSYSPAMMRNTYLTYRSSRFGLTAGNINQNMDIILNGRGLSLYIADSSSHNRYEAGVLDGNSNLVGNNNESFYPSSRGGWGSFTHSAKTWELASSAVYSANPILNTRSTLVGNTLTLNNFRKFRILASVNGGQTKDYENPDKGRQGISAALNVNGMLNKVLISSQNYFSTGYYPGQRSGAQSFTERITWLRKASNLWTSIEYNRYAPQTKSIFQTFLPVYSSLRAEVGLSGSPTKHFFISAAPKYIIETNNAFKLINAPEKPLSMKSWNVNNAVNYSFSDGQYLSINSELGLYTTTFENRNNFHMRSNLNIRKGIFNLSSTLQIGAFYIGDAGNQYINKTGTLKSIVVTPSIQKDLFRNKVHVQSGLSFISNSIYGNSTFMNGRADYDVNSKTNVYAAYNRNQYYGLTYGFMEMGITWKLSLPKPGEKNTNLEIFVFKDINQNGVYDHGDTEAANHLLYVDKVALITNASGKANYKRLPNGRYKISVTNIDGWYAPEMKVDLDQKKQKLEIPLGQTGTLKGTLSYVFSEFSYEISPNLQGITMVALDENNVRHITKTNAEGQYIFYLPIGCYSILVDAGSLPKEVIPKNTDDILQLLPDTPQIVDIKLVVKSKKVETKKFVSPNIYLKR